MSELSLRGDRLAEDVGCIEEKRDVGAAIAAGLGEVLAPEVQQRLEVIQALLRYQGNDRYGEQQREAAKALRLSIRGVQRLVKAWREQGISGIMPRSRRDRGEARISEEWQKFIVKTYP